MAQVSGVIDTSSAGKKSGVYCIVMSFDKEKGINIGKSRLKLPEGFYCYVGSDSDMHNRIKEHVAVLSRRRTGKDNIHIDHLIKHAYNILHHNTLETEKKLACTMNRELKALSKYIVKGFSAGCRCDSHLHYFEINPLFYKEFHNIFEGRKARAQRI